MPLSDELNQKLQQSGQGHIVRRLARLPSVKQYKLIQQLQQLDLTSIAELFQLSRQKAEHHDFHRCTVPDIVRMPETDAAVHAWSKAGEVGAAAIRQGQLAIIMVAGGQGTRLGHDGPKGTYPIGPVTQRSLFQIHAEKVLALGRRHQVDIPFLIMTSEENDQATREFFAQHQYFGLKPEQAIFFMQGMLPALDATTGEMLFSTEDQLALSPNGHGGVIEALDAAGLLKRLHAQGIRYCYYFQVDNPLVQIGEEQFLGMHVNAQADMSLKVVAKLNAQERMGNLVQLDGKYRIVEYTELPAELAGQTDEQGQLRFWAGSPAIHLFSLDFLQQLAHGDISLPYHIAHKCVPFVDEQGTLHKPTSPNAVKFERFIFDALPLARKVLAVETLRKQEFEPLKNAEGDNSPFTVRQALSDRYQSWLVACGIELKNDHWYELSPLVLLDMNDLRNQTPSTLIQWHCTPRPNHIQHPTFQSSPW